MNILVIGACCGLFQPKSGGRSRFYNIIKPLNERNKIFVLHPCLYKDENDKTFDSVYYFRSNIINRTFNILADFNPFFIFKLLKIIKSEKLDIIQISHPYGVFSTKIIIKLMKKEIKIVFDSHNVEKEIAEAVKLQEIPYPEKLFAFFYILYVPFIEKLALRSSDYVLAVSDEDRNSFIKNFKIESDKVFLVPSGIDINDVKNGKKLKLLEDIKKEGKCIIFFHGSYFHPPNREAIDLIRRYIAPKLLNAFFLIAGTDVPIFEENNVKSVGFVEDIYSYMQMADIAIVPILSGGGTRLKILDYMMMGLPIITTKKGIEGIKAKNMENAIIVKDVGEEFINSIECLIKNPNKREIMGNNNRRLIKEKYDYQKIGLELNNIYNGILSGDK